MPMPSFISRCLPSQVDDEKSPVSGPSDGQDDGQASCIGATASSLRKCLGMGDMRPPFSGLDTTTGKSPAPAIAPQRLTNDWKYIIISLLQPRTMA